MNTRTQVFDGRARVRNSGFSLVELVVTMVIAAILAAIAIPAYSNYVRKARRVEARTAILDIASLEERWFSTNNSYTDIPSNLGYSGAAGTAFNVGSGYYSVLVSKVDATSSTTLATYNITANVIATSDQVKDTQCAQFSITQQGVQAAQTAASVDSTSTCWH